MPTGYTAGIIDGKITTFPQFAKICMRAFGAVIHMRDEDMYAEYKQRVPSTYYKGEMDKANQQLKDAKDFSDEKILEMKKAELEEDKKHYINSIHIAKQKKKQLTAMLNEVNNWTPPTEKHEGLKKFMQDQITQTIEFDCVTSFQEERLQNIEIKLQNLNASDIRKEMVEVATKNFEYHSTEYNKELSRCNESNKWVEDLINSLPKTEQSTNDQLSQWITDYDNGKPVKSVLMGGLGDDYEIAIQNLAIDIIRIIQMIKKPEDREAFSKAIEVASESVLEDQAKHGGLSGAQFGAAKNIVAVFWKKGPEQAIKMMEKEDPSRVIEIKNSESRTIIIKSI